MQSSSFPIVTMLVSAILHPLLPMVSNADYLPLETGPVAMTIIHGTLKLDHQTSVVPYSTDNCSKVIASNNSSFTLETGWFIARLYNLCLLHLSEAPNCTSHCDSSCCAKMKEEG